MSVRLLCLLLIVCSSSALAEERLRLHGSNTIGERLAPELARAWLRAEGFADILAVQRGAEEIELHGRQGERLRIVEIKAHGSSTGFAGLASGMADVGMASRPTREGDAPAATLGRLADPRQEVVLALDGLAIIVHPDSPLRTLHKSQVKAIFSGAATDWSQFGAPAGRIALHARDENSGTWESFRALVLGGADLSPTAARYESTRQLAQAVAADPNAIGFVGLVGTEGVRALAIADGGAAIAPQREDVAVEDYPLSRRLYFYLPPQPDPLARAFVDFALGEAGQALVEQIGFVSQNIRAYASTPRSDAPTDYRQMVGGAQRLSLNFRFDQGSARLDSKAQRDLDRLVRFMGEPAQKGRPLLLMGFSDSDETLPYLALSLSNDRVDFVADRLAALGLHPARARGMGGTAPVAANDSALGRQRNRRVEAWLGAPGDRVAGSR